MANGGAGNSLLASPEKSSSPGSRRRILKRPMQRAPFATAALLLLLSCSDKSKRDAPLPPSGSSFSGKSTAALVQRPEVAALVDDLAREETLESSHIGAAGAPSSAYAKFIALQAKATEAELASLLNHQNAVVRGYAAQYVADHLPSHMGALVSLAADTTVVPTLSGCIGGSESMDRIVLDALCYSDLPEAGGALVAIAEKGGRAASEALVCAAPSAPEFAAKMAARALRGSLTLGDEAAYLRTLALAPTPDPNDGCALARPRTTRDNASVQIGAAQALWHCNDGASQKALLDLASGRNLVVARHAKASLFLAVPGRRDELAGDREVLYEVHDRLGKALRSPEGTRASLALVESLALAYPDKVGAPLYRALVTPETTQAALRIAAKTEPGKFKAWNSVRTEVIAYLTHAKEPAARSEFRRSLDSIEPTEIAAALRGIEALKDSASRAKVEKLTTHSDTEVARAAKQALAHL